MSDIELYDACDQHETTFIQGDSCPECEDEMWEYTRSMALANWLAAETQLIYEDIRLIGGLLYRCGVEELPTGDLVDYYDPMVYSCPEPGVPF